MLCEEIKYFHSMDIINAKYSYLFLIQCEGMQWNISNPVSNPTTYPPQRQLLLSGLYEYNLRDILYKYRQINKWFLFKNKKWIIYMLFFYTFLLAIMISSIVINIFLFFYWKDGSLLNTACCIDLIISIN